VKASIASKGLEGGVLEVDIRTLASENDSIANIFKNQV
jgi:hypothetical protein